jgi:peroxiredoxin family protein
MTTSDGLSLVVFSGGYDRVHYALAMASAAAATGRPVALLVSGRALRALVDEDTPGVLGWHDLDPAEDGSRPIECDRYFSHRGIATFEELLAACVALEVKVIACEMGVRALGLPADVRLRADVPVTIGGIVSFLNSNPGAGMTVI